MIRISRGRPISIWEGSSGRKLSEVTCPTPIFFWHTITRPASFS
uniref:Uncharacterized protein n=1 Tax=Anguilla anguilla TaxID=7936 RepID=A0A0E9RM11_ANGAN